tara:strand:+ start:353 stop:616 length:264 start_codon:yes stop_codon:yes gene_type:complete
MTERKSYRFLTGPDDASFCQRISDALAEGYILYGNPVMVVCDGARICGQAVILPEYVPAYPVAYPVADPVAGSIAGSVGRLAGKSAE